MTLGLLYWIVYLVALIFGFAFADRSRPYWYGGSLVTAILFFIIGWRLFGFPVHP